MLELADKHVSEACAERRTGSTPVSRTNNETLDRHEDADFLMRIIGVDDLTYKLTYKLTYFIVAD